MQDRQQGPAAEVEPTSATAPPSPEPSGRGAAVATTSPPETFAPIFIIGNPRSGTSTLAATLDRHSKIAVPPENQFFSFLPGARRRGLEGDREAMLDYFLRTALWNLRLDPGRVRERFRGDEPTFANFYRRALEEFADRHGKSRIGEKSIDHIYDVAEIAAAYPLARFVFLARDGRDSVQAALRTRVFSTTRRRSSHRWNSGVRAFLAARERYGDRMLMVRFEDLLREPEVQLRRMFEFLGEEYEDQVLDFTRPTASMTERELTYKARAYSKLDPSIIGEYDRKAGEREKWLMDSVMARSLSELGYGPTNVRPCPPWLRAWNALVNAPWAVVYHPRLTPLRNRIANRYHELRAAIRRGRPSPDDGLR